MNSNLYTGQSSRQNSLQMDDRLISALKMQKEEINKMKQQNKILSSMAQKIAKKDEQINELQSLMKKYKKYYEQFQNMKASFNQKKKQTQRLSKQNQVLFSQMTNVITQNKDLQNNILALEKSKHDFIKQRNGSDARLRGIQETFREYQQQCKNKQRDLLFRLESAHNQIKEQSLKIEQLQLIKFQNQQLKQKYNSKQILSSSRNVFDKIKNNENSNLAEMNSHNFSKNLIKNHIKSQQKSINKSNSKILDNQQMLLQLQRLRKQLSSKQMELQRSKTLNHQLSIQFDKSVSKICEFQKQLSMYRRQNHELKKTLSLFVQKQQYEKMHKNNFSHQVSEDSSQQNTQQQGNIGYSQISNSRR